ncbi:hypothetical protein DFO61_2970 [Ectopseudomonas oleovorans]|uniref:Pyridoxamine 5'-phosphate oxidase putative domain-containing protein n=1 Tax=Ectopseudomonas oleovorans TaxID=301 RepID=A0A397MIX3_ECTOL|nr:pyridoxamine 5'-phosphate oxidase family protein [Pseudomonas oleovorans]RIA22295.1 hypothetical protein DFO61_2970 [Pseudomonas oleovorans]
MNHHRIESLKRLRTLIAAPPPMMSKRLQPTIDEYCLTIIEHSTACALGYLDPALDIQYFNLSDGGVMRAEGRDIHLAWPADRRVPARLEHAAVHACSLLFIMPGIGFALRANGHCSLRQDAAGSRLEFRADALFLHCSRAKVRAGFWEPRPPLAAPSVGAEGTGPLSDAAQVFIAASPYLLMLTHNGTGATEISPRGDPDGFVCIWDRRTLLIPERPGNKVACSLSNILSAEAVTLSFLIPGSSIALSVVGRAQLTADPALLQPLAIKGKLPVVATVLQVERYRFVSCSELVEAGLWRKETHINERDMPSFAKMLSEHMNGKGMLGKATTLVVGAVVRHDLNNLY